VTHGHPGYGNKPNELRSTISQQNWCISKRWSRMHAEDPDSNLCPNTSYHGRFSSNKCRDRPPN